MYGSMMSSCDAETTRQEGAMSLGNKSTLQDRSGDTEQTQSKRRDGERLKPSLCSSNDTFESGIVEENVAVKKVQDADAGTIVVPEATETWSFVYKQLARQLEYYFSEKNLAKDTYLRTLKRLNDGCVPLSILANFSMVKRLVMPMAAVIDDEGRQAAVEEAVRNHSSLLTIRSVDTKTGLRVESNSDHTTISSHQILVVGTVDAKPLAIDPTPSHSSSVVNTIVLRDVQDGVTPDDIKELFRNDNFPSVTSIKPDVANCW
jgi:hypothetical protein